MLDVYQVYIYIFLLSTVTSVLSKIIKIRLILKMSSLNKHGLIIYRSARRILFFSNFS